MTALPTVVSPSFQDPARGAARGGFAWWYVDLVDEQGNGLVAIISLGLPFLPGYASLARVGQAPPAHQRPSVFVSVLRDHRLAFWALHEVDPAEVVWESDRARLGACTLRVSRHHGQLRLRADLSGHLPGCPWQADLEVTGPMRQASGPHEPSTDAHEWTILTACARGEASLRAGAETFDVSGRAYFDRNAGDASLEGLECASWTWGRLAFPRAERVWYLATDPEGHTRSLSMTVHDDGRSELVQDAVQVSGVRRGRWRLPYPAQVAVDDALTVTMPRPVDDSPFYARFLVRGERDGELGHGFAEACVPSRIDQAWFRPLVRMTVAREQGPNSLWLPLFGGPLRGRFARLARSFAGAA